MKTIHEYQTALELLRTNVIAELTTIAEQAQRTGDWEVTVDPTEQSETDENTEADAAEELTNRAAVVAELEIVYRSIERALEKISTDTFGFCEICTAPIEPIRLEALPSARTCIQHRDQETTLPL